LMNTLLAELPQAIAQLYAYAGWNTPGNTLGSALAMGIVRWWAEKQHCFDGLAFKQLLFLRLADDWLYQSQVRTQLRQKLAYDFGAIEQLGPSEAETLNTLMDGGLKQLKSLLQLQQQALYCRFPCKRSFEIQVDLLP
jgi:hypothetical protein